MSADQPTGHSKIAQALQDFVDGLRAWLDATAKDLDARAEARRVDADLMPHAKEELGRRGAEIAALTHDVADLEDRLDTAEAERDGYAAVNEQLVAELNEARDRIKGLEWLVDNPVPFFHDGVNIADTETAAKLVSALKATATHRNRCIADYAELLEDAIPDEDRDGFDIPEMISLVIAQRDEARAELGRIKPAWHRCLDTNDGLYEQRDRLTAELDDAQADADRLRPFALAFLRQHAAMQSVAHITLDEGAQLLAELDARDGAR